MPAKKDTADTERLIHELQVHPIELERQNGELRQAQEEIEPSRGEYAEFYDFAPAGDFTFGETGKVLAANLAGSVLVGQEGSRLVNRVFLPLAAEPSA